MPTAKAAANIQYDILNKEDGAARDSNQNRLSRGPSDGVHFRSLPIITILHRLWVLLSGQMLF